MAVYDDELIEDAAVLALSKSEMLIIDLYPLKHKDKLSILEVGNLYDMDEKGSCCDYCRAIDDVNNLRIPCYIDNLADKPVCHLLGERNGNFISNITSLINTSLFPISRIRSHAIRC